MLQELPEDKEQALRDLLNRDLLGLLAEAVTFAHRYIEASKLLPGISPQGEFSIRAYFNVADRRLVMAIAECELARLLAAEKDAGRYRIKLKDEWWGYEIQHLDVAQEPPQAVVREIDGQLVLDDPEALAMAAVVAKFNCRGVFDAQQERIRHFQRRVTELGRSGKDSVIVIINVDASPAGAELAEVLMPGYDWQEIRDRRQVPFARGLATREGIEGFLTVFDVAAAEKLKQTPGLAAVVVDHGVAEVFEVPEAA